MREPVARTGILDNAFIKEVTCLRIFIKNIKRDCDKFNNIQPSYKDIISYINSHNDTFHILDKYFNNIWQYVTNLPAESYRHHQVYIQNMLLPYFSTPPLNSRIHDKPFGYDGDYIMMNYYYNNAYDGNTVFDVLMHRYTLHTPVAIATANRFNYLYNHIKSTIKCFGKKSTITSLGCGAANEIIKYIRKESSVDNVIFNCIDAEPRAIEEIKHNLKNISNNMRYSYKINLFNYNILKYIKTSNKDNCLNKQSLIYASGLFDYLVDKVAKRLIETMYSLLTVGGEIVISNFSKEVPLRAYLELLGAWYLILRNEKDLLNLCSNIIDKASNVSLKRDEETNTLIYLIIKK